MQWIEKHGTSGDALKSACDFISAHPAFIDQSLQMANILEGWQCDEALLTAGILYPAVSHDHTLLEKCEKQFDKAIIKMIHGALQMEIIHHANNSQVDALRKMMLAMVDDIRTVLLKLSERLYLILNLESQSTEKQKRIAQETMDYYAPLANRLGMGQLKWQLEDGAFRYLYPADYQKIAAAFELRQADRPRIFY